MNQEAMTKESRSNEGRIKTKTKLWKLKMRKKKKTNGKMS